MKKKRFWSCWGCWLFAALTTSWNFWTLFSASRYLFGGRVVVTSVITRTKTPKSTTTSSSFSFLFIEYSSSCGCYPFADRIADARSDSLCGHSLRRCGYRLALRLLALIALRLLRILVLRLLAPIGYYGYSNTIRITSIALRLLRLLRLLVCRSLYWNNEWSAPKTETHSTRCQANQKLFGPTKRNSNFQMIGHFFLMNSLLLACWDGNSIKIVADI